MKTIGMKGGSSVCDLGPAPDVEAFFACVRKHAVPATPALDWRLLTDRLYRRYLRLGELDAAIGLMQHVRRSFGSVPGEDVDWRALGVVESRSALVLTAGSLDRVFGKYFEHFETCVESARVNLETFRDDPSYEYEPVMLVIADLPWLIEDTDRPLEAYDELNGPPFWAR